jgi:hypothetical protein
MLSLLKLISKERSSNNVIDQPRNHQLQQLYCLTAPFDVPIRVSRRHYAGNYIEGRMLPAVHSKRIKQHADKRNMRVRGNKQATSRHKTAAVFNGTKMCRSF